ncbi:hypothetical protein K1719_016200 [Acacia pycnantha]|nr:hypothetical protein K1719_016200 [Acacia pycnantha]
MAETTSMSFTKSHSNVELEDDGYDEEYEMLSQECKELLSLPRKKGCGHRFIYRYQDIWYIPTRIQNIVSFQKHFQAKDSDIIIASLPKSGTTWLKALTFSILNRKRFPPSQNNHPLLSSNPHELVPIFEYNHYAYNQIPDLSILPEPRLFSTHVPFHSLPDSITKSKCKIIYICRNPFDNFISLWLFVNKFAPPSLPKLSCEEAFERYSNGINECGPFWIHMLGYWRASKERQNKILFLSFEKLTELEVNKTGKFMQKFENKDFFRKGVVGDWVNHFSPWMIEKLSKVMEEKFGGSGLSFQYNIT